jgi:hypothetical protein
MNDLIGIGFLALLVLAALFGLIHLSKPYDVSTEEFEKRAHEAPSLISAGMSGLQKILDPAAGKAMEVQEDFKQGYYNGEQESGDGPEAGDEQKKPNEPRIDTDSHG